MNGGVTRKYQRVKIFHVLETHGIVGQESYRESGETLEQKINSWLEQAGNPQVYSITTSLIPLAAIVSGTPEHRQFMVTGTVIYEPQEVVKNGEEVSSVGAGNEEGLVARFRPGNNDDIQRHARALADQILSAVRT